MASIRLIALSLFASFLIIAGCQQSSPDAFHSNWTNVATRSWAGPDYWANRLQDWHIASGRLETTEPASDKPMRTLHLLTRRLNNSEEAFSMEVETGWLEADNVSDKAEVGFLVGAGGMLDYRAAALIHHSAGPGAGVFAGMDHQGRLFFRDLNAGDDNTVIYEGNSDRPASATLLLEGSMQTEGYTLILSRLPNGASSPDQSIELSYQQAQNLSGNVALVSSFDRAWFNNWQVDGTKFEVYEDRNAGPILAAQHTLNNQVLKLTAQLMPVADTDPQVVKLETQKNGQWTVRGTADLITPGWTATFRITDWDDTEDTPYRVTYELTDGPSKAFHWEGTIRRDPVDKDIITIAGFTGNHNVARGIASGTYQWNDHIWFPHNDVTDHVAMHNPDVLFFSGDQIYEGASPTFPDRANATLDYMYKWYLWSWAFRDIARDRPTIMIPDDHDVYQGNIWGAGGRATDKDDKGGYVMPAAWVKMIERTQTSHLPDPYDPTPIDQGIGVYYSRMNYGRIGLAIIEDRKFKSGCDGLVPGKQGRADHFASPDFNPAIVDLPGLQLLGNRQQIFLEDWASDWRGHDMKVVLSQTVFANMATHHGPNLMRLYGDLDSNGWPKRGRDAALREIRKGFAFMLQGDQHLSTIVHHGIDAPNDAGYSFCVPSIANFYPRAWMPEAEGQNRAPGMAPHLGEHRDAFGNFVTVYGATNPTGLTGISTGVEPLALHDRMPGYGIVHFNKSDRTITMENWPRYADPSDPATGGQYEGWPKTIPMEANYGRQAVAYLPTIEVTGMVDPVVQVVDEASQEIVYTIRIQGTSFQPKVFRTGTYTVHVGNQDADQMQTFNGVSTASSGTLPVVF